MEYTHYICKKIFEVSTGRSAQFDRPLSASGKFPSSAILSALEQSAVSTNVQDKSHLGVEGIALFTFHVMDKSVNISPPSQLHSILMSISNSSVDLRNMIMHFVCITIGLLKACERCLPPQCLHKMSSHEN